MGIGIGSGEERVVEAARKGNLPPLLETTIDGAGMSLSTLLVDLT